MSLHETLLKNYVAELASAHARAMTWWEALLKAALQRTGSAALARQEVRGRWPDGPASHPCVLAVVRKYWLLCDALNREHESAERVRESENVTFVLRPDEDPYAGEAGYDAQERPITHVDCHVFMLEWLLDDENEALGAFLSSLSYWPIGVDAHGAYC